MWRVLVQVGHWSGEVWNRRRDGDVYAQLLTISAVRDVAGQVRNYVSLFTDITQIKEQQQALERIAQYDRLTNLPNRGLLADRLQQAMLQSQRRHQSLAVVFPALLRHERERKAAKLLQYGERIFGISEGIAAQRIEQAIDRTERFFRSLGVGTRLSDYGIQAQGLERIGRRISERDGKIGEHQAIGQKEIDEILFSALNQDDQK
ncbi:MAG: Alcohol dehydrogenase YqhD [bacterium ADurb.Bin478]|nr:MAG: Alcohol dehydrogenase YqhD [bacterium ADurb.Bin478]